MTWNLYQKNSGMTRVPRPQKHQMEILSLVPVKDERVDGRELWASFFCWIGEWMREIAVLEPEHLRQTLIDSCDICKAKQIRIGQLWDAAQSHSGRLPGTGLAQ